LEPEGRSIGDPSVIKTSQLISIEMVQLGESEVVDDKVLADCLNDVSRALLQADVHFETVRTVQASIRSAVNLQSLAAGTDKRRAIKHAVVDELRRPRGRERGISRPASSPGKGGSQPAWSCSSACRAPGKTTTCVKYADYHRRMGFSPALVCADTFRADALDQLAQNAAKAGIPFYGSYAESDPVKVTVEGVDRFRNDDQAAAAEGCDLIVVDTSGRHSQEAALLEEMRQVAEATRPNLVVLVMDASIGQGALYQALAFKQSADVGAVIVTKMDGHAKLSAVAATKSPVIFIGTGEHVADLEAFDARSFMRRLLGMGDLPGFMDKICRVPSMSDDDQGQGLEQLLHELTVTGASGFTLRQLYTLFRLVQSMGPLGHLVSFLPTGLLGNKGKEKEGQAKMKGYVTIMDSMTAAELDGTNPMKLMMTNQQSRINRVARGSGRPVSQALLQNLTVGAALEPL
jgi:signal recognition particle subunit SRP54